MQKHWIVAGLAGALFVGGAIWKLSAPDKYAADRDYLRQMRPRYHHLLKRLQAISATLPGTAVTEPLDPPLVYDRTWPEKGSTELMCIEELQQLEPTYRYDPSVLSLGGELEELLDALSSPESFYGRSLSGQNFRDQLDRAAARTYIVLYKAKGHAASPSQEGKSYSGGETDVEAFVVDMRRDAVVRVLKVEATLPSSVAVKVKVDRQGSEVSAWNERQSAARSALREARRVAARNALIKSLTKLGH